MERGHSGEPDTLSAVVLAVDGSTAVKAWLAGSLGWCVCDQEQINKYEQKSAGNLC